MGDAIEGDAAAVALIGDGGVGEAIADDDVPSIQGRADQFIDVLSAGGGEDQQFGGFVETKRLGPFGDRMVEGDRSSDFAEWGAARLAREDDAASCCLQPFGERVRLG